MRASQLPAMEAAFAKAGLSDYQIEGNRIRVPLGRQSVYMGALADGGALPADFGKYLEKAVGTSPWVSKVQRAEAMKIAKQIELQSIICHMQGIESASVMYDAEESKSLIKEKVTTASVSVKPLGAMQLDDNQVRMLRHLVAGAFAGLKPQSVTVTDLNSKTYPGSSSADGIGGGDDDPYNTRKRIYEKQWNEKIASALSYIPGVLVTSNVELDAETMHEETSTDFDPKTVPYEQREEGMTKTVRGSAGGGRPGLAQQHGVNQPATVSQRRGHGKLRREHPNRNAQRRRHQVAARHPQPADPQACDRGGDRSQQLLREGVVGPQSAAGRPGREEAGRQCLGGHQERGQDRHPELRQCAAAVSRAPRPTRFRA